MKSSFVSLSVPIAMIFSVKYASSIMCYDCNSAFDPRCGPEFDSFSLGVVNCSLRDRLEHINHSDATLCRTIKMEIFGKIRVVRTCGYLVDTESNATCRRISGVGEVFTTYCACDTDLCNTASTAQYQEMALISISVIAAARLLL